MRADSLRVSVIDRCNLRCAYRHSLCGYDLLKREEILKLEEIVRIIRLFAKCGIRKVRLIDVEMEALTGAGVACLTIYDMLKYTGKAMIISQIKLLEKTGGKSGDCKRQN